MENLLFKSGYKGKLDSILLETIKVRRFKTQKYSLSVTEYMKRRKWLLENK